MELGRLHVLIQATDTDALRKLDGVDRRGQSVAASLKRTFANTQLRLPTPRFDAKALEQAALGAGRTLSLGLSAPLGVLGAGAIKAATDMDSLKRALIAVSGSSEAANEQLVRLREIAKLPGIDFTGAIQGSVRLQAVEFSARDAESALKAFANAIATTGGTPEQLREITVQLTQMAGKSKVLAQDLRPIIEAAPAVARALKNAFGTVSPDAISEKLEKAGLDSKQFIQLLVREMDKLPKVTAGARESFDNLKITANQALAEIGVPILKIVIPAIERLTPKIEAAATAFSKLSPEAQNAALGIAAVGFAAGPILSVIGNLTLAATGAAALAAKFRNLALGAAATGAAIKGVSVIANASEAAAVKAASEWAAFGAGMRVAAGGADAAAASVGRLAGAMALLGKLGRLSLYALAVEGVVNTNTDYAEKQAAIARKKYGISGDERAEQARLAAGGAERDRASRDKLFGQFKQQGPRGIGAELAARTTRLPVDPYDEWLKKLNAPVVPKAPGGGGGGGGSRAAEITEAGRLTKQLVELNKEIGYLGNTTSKEYQLRLAVLGAEETRDNLQEIINLKRSLFEEGPGGELGQLQSLQKYDEQQKENRQLPLVPYPSGIAEGIQEAATAYDALNKAIEASRPALALTNEQRLTIGDLAKEYEKLNGIEKQIVLTRAQSADAAIKSAKATEYLDAVSKSLGDEMERLNQSSSTYLNTFRELSLQGFDMASAGVQKVLKAAQGVDTRKREQSEQDRIADETQRFEERMRGIGDRLGQDFDDVITSLFEGGGRWIDAAKRLVSDFFNSIAQEMMLAATGGKYGSIGGLLGGVLGDALKGAFGGVGGGGGNSIIPGTDFNYQYAAGGRVYAGQRGLWNEPGNTGELFIPAGNGYILNRRDAMQAVAMAGAPPSNATININVPIHAPSGTVTPPTRQQIAALVGQEVQRAMRRNG